MSKNKNTMKTLNATHTRLATGNHTREAIINEIQFNGGYITILRLVKRLNISRTAVVKHLRRLKKMGILTRTGSNREGRWKVTPCTAQQLSERVGIPSNISSRVEKRMQHNSRKSDDRFEANNTCEKNHSRLTCYYDGEDEDLMRDESDPNKNPFACWFDGSIDLEEYEATWDEGATMDDDDDTIEDESDTFRDESGTIKDDGDTKHINPFLRPNGQKKSLLVQG